MLWHNHTRAVSMLKKNTRDFTNATNKTIYHILTTHRECTTIEDDIIELMQEQIKTTREITSNPIKLKHQAHVRINFLETIKIKDKHTRGEKYPETILETALRLDSTKDAVLFTMLYDFIYDTKTISPKQKQGLIFLTLRRAIVLKKYKQAQFILDSIKDSTEKMAILHPRTECKLLTFHHVLSSSSQRMHDLNKSVIVINNNEFHSILSCIVAKAVFSDDLSPTPDLCSDILLLGAPSEEKDRHSKKKPEEYLSHNKKTKAIFQVVFSEHQQLTNIKETANCQSRIMLLGHIAFLCNTHYDLLLQYIGLLCDRVNDLSQEQFSYTYPSDSRDLLSILIAIKHIFYYGKTMAGYKTEAFVPDHNKFLEVVKNLMRFSAPENVNDQDKKSEEEQGEEEAESPALFATVRERQLFLKEMGIDDLPELKNFSEGIDRFGSLFFRSVATQVSMPQNEQTEPQQVEERKRLKKVAN